MKLVRLTNTGFVVLFFFYLILLFLSYILILTSLFLVLNVPIFILVAFLFTILTLFIFFQIFLYFARKIKGLFPELEKRLFGKRMFIIDTLVELKKKKNDIHTRELIRNLENRPEYHKEIRSTGFKILKISIFFILLNLFLLTLIICFVPHAFEKKVKVENFLERKNFNIILPYFYTIGEKLEIHFPIIKELDKVILVISNTLFEIKSESFSLPEKWTQNENLPLKIYVVKYGLKKLVINKMIYGTIKFLPVELRHRIIYPENLIEPEENEGIKSMEVYYGVKLSIFGKMSKEIKSIDVNIPCRNIEINRENFLLILEPKKKENFSINLKSIYNDTCLLNDLKINLLENKAPELTIEFPKEEIILKQSLWKLSALINGSDDQGINKISVDCTIENDDKNLSFLRIKKSFSYNFPAEKELQKILSYTSRDLELLPGDRAIFRVKAYDIFGKASEEKNFSLYSPDFEWLEKIFNASLKDIKEILSNIGIDMISGKEMENIKKEKYLKDLLSLSNTLDGMEKIFQNSQETKELIEKMKSISKKIEDFLNNKDEFLTFEENLKENINLKFENPKEYLWQMEKLLEVLNLQKEIVKKEKLINDIKNLLNELKNEVVKERFDKNFEAYKKFLAAKKDSFFNDEKPLIDELLREADNLKFKDEKSFYTSEELIKKLSENLNKSLISKKNKSKNIAIENLLFMIEETLLCHIINEEIKNLIPSIVTEEQIIKLKAIFSSIESLKKLYREKLGFYFILYKDFYKPIEIMQDIENIISETLENLKEKKNILFKSLPELSFKLRGLYFSLKSFIRFLENTDSESSSPTPLTLSLSELIKMQQLITMGLEKMLSEKKGSPEYEDLKEELSKLQESINKNFSRLLKEGAFSKGRDISEDMGNILKDIIEERVSEKTVEKSKKLEEKLLKSKKGLEKKGIQEERVAERPNEFIITPPENLILKPEVKKEFEEIKNLPFYYKKLIERYKKEMSTRSPNF